MPDAESLVGESVSSDWPDPGLVETSCEAVAGGHWRDEFVLEMACSHPETGESIDVRLGVTAGTADELLSGLVGSDALTLFFMHQNPEAPSSGVRRVSLLHQGALVLLRFKGYPSIGEGGSFDVGQFWEHMLWGAHAGVDHFTSLVVRDVGCSPREALRPGAELEIPLALQIEGPQEELVVHDRTVGRDFTTTDGAYDVFVRDAFSRVNLTCGNCAEAEVDFLIVRTSR